MRELMYKVGSAFREASFLERAVDAARKAMKIRPDYAKTFLKGQSFDKAGMFREAARAYRQAARIEANDSEVYNRLGNACCKLGRFREAVDAFKQSVRINPQDANAYYRLGNAYSRIGKYHAAIATTKRTIQLRPSLSDGYKSLGIYHSKLGMYREAKEFLLEALKLEEKNANARYYLVIVCLELEDREAAIQEYNTLKSICPRTAERLSQVLLV